VLGGITFLLALIIRVREPRQEIRENDIILRLEIEYPDKQPSPGILRQNEEAPESWREPLAKIMQDIRPTELSRNSALLSTLLIPFVVSFIALPKTAPLISTALAEVGDAVSRFNRGVHLTILQGAAKE